MRLPDVTSLARGLLFAPSTLSTGENMNRALTAFSALLLVSASACGTRTDSGASATPTPNGNAPVVSAAANVTSGMAPLAVQFTGVAAGGSGTVTYNWHFGG